MKSVAFGVDATAPQVTIDGANGQFTLNASEARARLECRVDAGAWVSCPRVMSLTLAPGIHVLEARATDQVGNTGLIARREWAVVERAAPIPEPSTPLHIKVTVRHQGLSRVIRKGLKIGVGCTASCRLGVVVARGRSVVARRSVRMARPAQLTLVLSRSARRSLASLRRVTFTITVSAARARTVRRKITLER